MRLNYPDADITFKEMTHQIEESVFFILKAEIGLQDGAQEMTPRGGGLNFTLNLSHSFRSSYQIHFNLISL